MLNKRLGNVIDLVYVKVILVYCMEFYFYYKLMIIGLINLVFGWLRDKLFF